MEKRPDYSRDRDVMTVINHMREAGYPAIMPNSRMAHDIYLALNKVKNNNYTTKPETDLEARVRVLEGIVRRTGLPIFPDKERIRQ